MNNAAKDYRKLLAAHGSVASMNRSGNYWDNAVAKSFFPTLRRELEFPQAEKSRRASASVAIFEFIERR